MSRTLTTATLVGFVVLMFTACSLPRKAGERACRKADRHLAKAVWLCPTALEHDTTPRTVEVRLPGDSAVVPVVLAHSLDVDSILAQCDQLREVIAAERDLYAAALERQTRTATDQPPRSPGPAVRRAVERLQERACQWDPITYDHELFTLTVAPGEAAPLITVKVKDRVATGVCPPCPPTVKMEQVVQHGVNPGWKTFGQWVLGLLSLLLVAALGVVWFVTKNHHAG